MFFAFPLNGKPDWLNPPWMTILLILVNCLVYLGPQRADERAWQRGVDFYAQSDLPALEFPRYADYLRQSDNPQPVWIAQEFLQQQLDVQGSVAYMAHAGGFVTGALLIAWYRWRHQLTMVELPEAARDDGFNDEKARAEALLRKMQLDAARAAYGRLVVLRPADRESLTKFFNLAKLVPADKDFHRAALRILALRETDSETDELVHGCFATYWRTARPRPRLGPDVCARLGQRFARMGTIDDAARLAGLLQQAAPAHDALPGLLLALIHGELRRDKRAQANEYAAMLNDGFPGSSEAKMAAGLLR